MIPSPRRSTAATMTAVIITSFFEGGGPGGILLTSASAPICRRSALHPGAFAGLVAPAPTCRRSALHPGDFLMRRKSPKTHQGPPGPWTSGEGGLAPFDPPTLYPRGIVRNNLNPQASSGATHLPSHGLTTEGVTPVQLGEKKRPVCPPAQSGKSVLFCGKR